MQEKRKFNRCKMEQKARISTDVSQDKKGLLVDISTGGMRILLDSQVKIGSQLSGQFKIVPYLGPFYVKGLVVWTRPTKDTPTPRWEVGVKFTKVSTIPI